MGKALSLPSSDRGCGHISVSPDKGRAMGLSLGGGISQDREKHSWKYPVPLEWRELSASRTAEVLLGSS